MSEQMNYAGLIVIVGICIILGAGLIPTLGTYTGQMTNTVTLTNQTFAIGADGVTIDLTGQSLLSTPIVLNATDNVVISSGNYTISEGVSKSTGFKTIQYTTKGSTFASRNVKISYLYGDQGYVDNAGARAIVPLIIVFFALLILVIALTPVMRNSMLEMVGLR